MSGTRKWTLVLASLVLVAPPASAQFEGSASYEMGVADTDIGDEDGKASVAYSFGVGASYRMGSDEGVGFVFGVDLLVRAFGIDIPGLVDQPVAVFDQSDLFLDQFAALSFSRVMAGVYFEQRRIDRGFPLGTIGFPAAGVGFLVNADVNESGRTKVQFTYANFLSGTFELVGIERELDSGRSFRISLRHDFASRWGVRGEYADTRLNLEPVDPTLSFFDHRQRSFSAGAVLTF